MSLRRLAVWLVAAFVLGTALLRLGPVVRDQLAAPFDLISEGPHMSTIKAIRSSVNIYDPATVLDLPFHASPYTPLYHWIVAQLPARAANPFFPGRVVALLFMTGAAASLAVVAARPLLPASALALGCFLLLHPVTGNTAYLRSDSMALFFSVWAVVTAAGIAQGPRHGAPVGTSSPDARDTGPSRGAAALAGVLAALAVAAKQSFYAAGLACLLFLLRDRRRAGAFLVAAGATTVLLAAAATWQWGTGFWFCVTLPLTDYPRDWPSFVWHWRMMFAQPVFVLIVAAAAGALGTVLWRAPRLLVATPFFVYMVGAWAGQTALMTGIGAENHNLIEPVLATLLWMLVTAGRPAVRLPLGPRGTTVLGATALGAVLAVVAVESRHPTWRDYAYTTPAHTAAYVRERAAIAAALDRLGLTGGQALNVKNSQVTHDYAMRVNVNDPWMYITVLWSSRSETERRLTRAIEAQYFDAVLTAPGVMSAAGQTLDNPAQRIIRTIFRHYVLAVHGSEVNVLTRIPRPPAP